MLPDDLSALNGLAAQIILGIALVLGFIGLRIYLFVRRLSRRRAAIQRAKAEGTFAPPSFLDGQQLPAQYDVLASVGTGRAAPVSIDERILRPAIGVRLFVSGLVAVIVGFVVMPGLAPSGFHEAMTEIPVPPQITQLVLLAAGAWSLAYIFGFEARYNTDRLIVTRLFKRREYRWKDLIWLKDDGAYDLVLTFEKGGKAKVLKHSVGVADFKTFAEGQAKRNRSLHA